MQPKQLIQFLNECFTYSKATGVLKWKKRPRNHFKSEIAYKRFDTMYTGQPAGTPQGRSGHLRVNFLNHRDIYVTRIIWILVTGEDPYPKLIDHKNGITDDNRWCNLRLATFAQNGWNTTLNKRNTSGIKGVSLNKATGKWIAYIMKHGKRVHLGLFEELEDAEAARRTAEAALHGEFVREL